jgi:biopolymer transport protein ExbD
MAAASKDEDDRLVSGINVTPLVDICLVLLIIMMVTARIIANMSVPLDLPKAAKGVDQQVFFSIDLTKEGSIFVDNEKVASSAAIRPLAEKALEKNPDIRATIRADQALAHGDVMEVIDQLRQAGINKVAFGVSPKSPETSTKPAN